MQLTETERQVVEVFKSAGFSGRAFKSMEACRKHLEASRKKGIRCPGHGREIGEVVCEWHRETVDPVCRECFRREAFRHSDGGRAEAGYKGETGDCAVRAISIATGKPYQEVYDEINALSVRERLGKNKKTRSSSRTGVYRTTLDKYLLSLGWKWIPTMQIGSGCKVHLKSDELPPGRLIVRVSKHLVAVIDGVIHDLEDPSRDGTRCVYGYFTK